MVGSLLVYGESFISDILTHTKQRKVWSLVTLTLIMIALYFFNLFCLAIGSSIITLNHVYYFHKKAFRLLLVLLVYHSHTLFSLSHQEKEEEVEDVYTTPKQIENVHLMETFDDSLAFESNWIRSQAKKEGVDDDIAKYNGKFNYHSH